MCATCGCSSTHEHEHEHARGEDHGHAHGHAHDRLTRTLLFEREILEKNALLARANQGWLARRSAVALNIVGAPGSGKTSLLEATIGALSGKVVVSVLEGDQETERDAARIRACGSRAIQINTGTGCHLDAHAVGHALGALDPPPRSLVMIENVGNLVCPALFDLGERAKVVVLSVTEGDDKPLKYPHIFRASEVLVLNKLDLAPHVRFDIGHCIENALAVNPKLHILALSATTGAGLDGWTSWLLAELAQSDAEARRPAVSTA